MSDPWHVEVVPLSAHDGWLLRCIERPDLAVQLSTLDDMGGRIAKAIAAAVGHTDTQGMVLRFSYPRGDITLYQLTREDDGTIGRDQVPGLRLVSASRTQDLVQAIAIADGVPADVVRIIFDPTWPTEPPGQRRPTTPKVAKRVGYWCGRAAALARTIRSRSASVGVGY
jgi:hypothetical protein